MDILFCSSTVHDTNRFLDCLGEYLECLSIYRVVFPWCMQNKCVTIVVMNRAVVGGPAMA